MKRNSFRNGMGIFATSFSQRAQRRKRRAFPIGFVVAALCIGAMSLPTAQVVIAGNKQTDKQSSSDLKKLEGRWVRPDGGYVLELSEIKKDGALKAWYFNPRPINVSSAKWTLKDGKINLFVELRDVNYPGSKYDLQYEPGSDRLKGTYFQAVEKQTFNIEFVRGK